MAYTIFLICLLFLWLMLPIHFFSVEHIKFQEKYGIVNGMNITKIFGMISGWGFFIFLFGIWISPQPNFSLPFYKDYLFNIPFINYEISLYPIIFSSPFIFIGALLGIIGVKTTTLKISETHKADKIITQGIYSKIRHPQYLGAILSHIGISILFSLSFSLLSTPLIILYNYIISWKEEKELIKEFGKDYEEYKKKVPMFFPRLKK